MTCPNCHYVLGDFDFECPRCAATADDNLVPEDLSPAPRIFMPEAPPTPGYPQMNPAASSTKAGKPLTGTERLRFVAVGVLVCLICGALLSAVINPVPQSPPDSIPPHPTLSSDGTASVTSTRLVPFMNSSGQQFQMVMTDWVNTGRTPIRSVFARIKSYDASGAVLDDIPYYCIYAAGSGDPGIQPGETYNAPPGEGYVLGHLFDGKVPTRAEVEILTASSGGL